MTLKRAQSASHKVSHRVSMRALDCVLKSVLLKSTILTASLFTLPLTAISAHAQSARAQVPTAVGTNRPVNLPENSPFYDPDIIYLEADELIDNQESGLLTAKGEVEGRYQDRTLRADQVLYDMETGGVIAKGNVVLVDGLGATQYADTLELSDTLEAGTASDFVARFPEGGVLAARFVSRQKAEGGIELYNAYYTACEACKNEDGSVDKPTWRIRARKVTQNPDKNTIFYRDAVVEFKGIPLLYTPYLSHPDPSAGRASGWLTPFGGVSRARGVEIQTPYFWALDDYSNLTVTPHVYTGVTPLLEVDYRRLFYSGEINVNGSLTYASWFDRDGNAFSNPALFTNSTNVPNGKRLRSHVFGNGLFDINKNWQWGFGVQAASDDLYLDRYNLNERPERFGLYEAASRRLVSQAFVIGQNEDFRFSTSTYGYQSLRTQIFEDSNSGTFTLSSENDRTLPIIAPHIAFERYFKEPLIGGRLKTFVDATALTRDIGTDYVRATGGLDWSKTMIAPQGVEVKPFANARYDYVEIKAEGQDSSDFSRNVGQVGADVRWPFIKTGQNIDFIIEPRVKVTQSFGDGKVDRFNFNPTSTANSLLQDSQDIDLDYALFWADNKSTGYDFWQEGFRADIGANFIADWNQNRAQFFIGQSYVSNTKTDFQNGSGLEGKRTDIIGVFELDLGGNFSTTTRVRFDDDAGKFRRIDSSANYNTGRFGAQARYYKLDTISSQVLDTPFAPSEELSGSVSLKLFDHWSTRYTATRDLNLNITRRENLGLIYDDECTRFEIFYYQNRNDLGVVGDGSGIGIRLSLLSLGEFSDSPTQ